jgi:hypothetical protein
MEEELGKRFVLDTSALLSLESCDILDIIYDRFIVLATPSVVNELQDFAKHSDKLGDLAKKVLDSRQKITIKEIAIEKELGYVSKTDKELFNLALQEKATLVSDDTQLLYHVDKEIDSGFSTIFLSLLIELEILTRDKALENLEIMRRDRNWQDNIIYVTTKEELEKM